MTPAEQLADLRRRVLKIERLIEGSPNKPPVLIKAMGQALGVVRHALEQRIDQLEQRQLKFLGVHEPGRSYLPGHLVVRRGGLWHCTTATTATPGHSVDWMLAVKSGEVSKDLAA